MFAAFSVMFVQIVHYWRLLRPLFPKAPAQAATNRAYLMDPQLRRQALMCGQQIIMNGINKKEAITKRCAVRCSCVCRDV